MHLLGKAPQKVGLLPLGQADTSPLWLGACVAKAVLHSAGACVALGSLKGPLCQAYQNSDLRHMCLLSLCLGPQGRGEQGEAAVYPAPGSPRRFLTKSSSFILRSGLTLGLYMSVLSRMMAKARMKMVSGFRNCRTTPGLQTQYRWLGGEGAG